MNDSAYSVRVDRSQGSVEISGPDKDWIAEQLATLMPILTAESAPPAKPNQGNQEGRKSVDATNGKARKTSGKSRRASKSSGKPNPDLSGKMTDEIKTKLSSYLQERAKNAKDAQSQAAVIATFLLDELQWAEVTADDLFTVYSDMGLKIPATKAALTNAQKRKGYFSAPDDGKFRISHNGMNFARHDSKDS
jgi:hypothetical protein